MRKLTSAVLVFMIGGTAFSAQAMPVMPAPAAGAAPVIEARYGCGPNGTRGPYGHCRPRFTCPPGWHPGPYGWHCSRNHW